MFSFLTKKSNKGSTSTGEDPPGLTSPKLRAAQASGAEAQARAAAIAAELDDDDDEEVPMPTSKLAQVAHLRCQPSAGLRKQIDDLKAANKGREISPERPPDFDEVQQNDTSLESKEALRACMASIFRRGLDDMPNFDHAGGIEPALAEWLSPQRKGVQLIPLNEQWMLPGGQAQAAQWVGSLGVVRGTSPRAGSGRQIHDVVVRVRTDGSLTIVHDPHPDCAGLASPLMWIALFPDV